MKAAIVSVSVILLLAGCQSQPRQTGMLNSFVPAKGGQVSVIDALNGGIMDPNVTASMTSQDRMRALEAEYRALEVAPSGQIVAWRGARGDVSGEVYAAQPYQVGSQNCRQYVHTIDSAGRSVSSRGTACRNDDGSWTPLV